MFCHRAKLPPNSMGTVRHANKQDVAQQPSITNGEHNRSRKDWRFSCCCSERSSFSLSDREYRQNFLGVNVWSNRSRGIMTPLFDVAQQVPQPVILLLIDALASLMLLVKFQRMKNYQQCTWRLHNCCTASPSQRPRLSVGGSGP